MSPWIGEDGIQFKLIFVPTRSEMINLNGGIRYKIVSANHLERRQSHIIHIYLYHIFTIFFPFSFHEECHLLHGKSATVRVSFPVCCSNYVQ